MTALAELTEEQAAKVALPGDPDIDIDLDGLTLVSVVRDGGEIIVRLTGGYGFWINADGGHDWFRLGTDARVDDVDINIDFGRDRLDLVDWIYSKLCGWRDTGYPLRMCCAPGKASALIGAGADDWVMLPRTPPRDPHERPIDTAPREDWVEYIESLGLAAPPSASRERLIEAADDYETGQGYM